MPGKKSVLGTMRTQGNSSSTGSVGLENEATVHKYLHEGTGRLTWVVREESEVPHVEEKAGQEEHFSEREVNGYRREKWPSQARLEI